jgi:predicted ATPase
MFTQINIENYKSVMKTKIETKEINIIIGPNNSGKSTLLEFIELYQSLLSNEVRDAFGRRPFDFRDVFCKGSDFETKPIKGEFHYCSEKDFNLIHNFSIESRYDQGNFELFANEHIKFNGHDNKYSDETKFHFKKEYDSRLIDPNSEIMDFIKECRSIKRYQFSPKEIKKENEIDITIDKRHIPFLRYNGCNLVEVLYHIRDNYPSNYSHIIEDFQKIYPDITGISFRHLGEQKYGIEFTKKTSKGEWTFIGPQISDGMAISLAIITLINESRYPRIILFEEIENGLNPKTLKIIFDRILEISRQKQMQFFITTHSPILLELMSTSPSYVIISEQKDGLSTFTPLNTILDKFGPNYEHGESLFHLWFNDLLGGL